MALASHCVRHPEVPANGNSLAFREPTQGQESGAICENFNTYIDVLLKKDAGMENREELATLMLNRNEWREVSRKFRDGGAPSPHSPSGLTQHFLPENEKRVRHPEAETVQLVPWDLTCLCMLDHFRRETILVFYLFLFSFGATTLGKDYWPVIS